MVQTKHKEDLFEEALNKGKSFYLSGQSNTYIELQLAEKNYPDAVIDRVLAEVSLMRKAEKRKKGMRKLISGSAIIVVSFTITWLSFHSESPIKFLMAGTGIIGIFISIQGLWEFLGFK